MTKSRLSIVVVCRGSVDEGLGHLYRAHTFAMLAQVRHDVRVVARTDNEFVSIFEGLHQPVVLAESDDDVARKATSQPADIVVIDMVDLATEAMRVLRDHARTLASISPVFRHADGTDLFFTRGHAPAGLSGRGSSRASTTRF